jgi:hypothetical protein
MGRIQGEKNEPAPASAEITMFASTMNYALTDWINTYFQIISILDPILVFV